MTAANRIDSAQLKIQGQCKARYIAHLLSKYDAKVIQSTGLEWGVWMGDTYCGGFCWDRGVWYRLDVPAVGTYRPYTHIPCPVDLRQAVRYAVNQALESDGGVA